MKPVEPMEQQAWEQFCKTGAVGDYLAYRQAVDFTCRQPQQDQQEEENRADYHRRTGGA